MQTASDIFWWFSQIDSIVFLVNFLRENLHWEGGIQSVPFLCTRSCAALRAADLDWIVRPEYSLGGKEEGVQGRNKPKM